MFRESKSLMIYLLLLVSILFVNCNDNSTPPEDAPPDTVEPFDSSTLTSPQVNIPWPSLANVPWAMNHGDPQSTGRSKYRGPSEGIFEKKVELYGIQSGLVIDENNNFYLGIDYHPGGFFGYDAAGNQKWSALDSMYTESTPMLTSDENILICGRYKNFTKLNKHGEILWEVDTEFDIRNLGINIGLDSTIYFVDYSHTLNAYSFDGEFLWSITDENFRHYVHGAPTFSPDGKYLYIQGEDVSFSTVNVEKKQVEWRFGNEQALSSPVIDNQGNIYIIPGQYHQDDIATLYSISSSGQINWKYEFNARHLFDNIEPTIDYNGNIYFGSDTLYSVNYLGKLRWKKDINNCEIVSPLICDVDNNIYIGTVDHQNGNDVIFSFDSSGEYRWEVRSEADYLLGASGGITTDGRLLFPSFESWNILILR